MRCNSEITKNKNLALQVLRCFAFLLVMLSHYPQDGGFPTSWGGVGVSIFVVLSGVVLTMEKDIDLLKERYKTIPYTVKRIKSIYPLHFLVFVFNIVISIITHQKNSFISIILVLTMTKAFVPIPEYYYGLMSPTWYLSLVWFFALMTPLLLKLIYKAKKRLCIVVLTVVLFRIIWICFWHSYDVYRWMTYVSPYFRLTDYLLGLILGLYIKNIADYFQKHKHIFRLFFLITGIVGVGYVVSLLLYSLPWFCVLIRTPLTVALIVCFYTANRSDGLFAKLTVKNPVLVFMGEISFELYILHLLAYTASVVICSRLAINSVFVNLTIAIIFAIIGALVYRFMITKLKIITKKLKKT